ncbi:MrcB family domain-containing protein [Ursidibacter sp. B-7004-1]
MQLDNIFKKVIQMWKADKGAFNSKSEAYIALNTTLTNKIKDIIKTDINSSYFVLGHSGQGNWASVPWLEISNLVIKENNNIYITYLFKSDFSGIYLSLQLKSERNKIKYNKQEIQQIISRVRSFLPWGNTQFSDEDISLPTKEIYERTNIISKYYSYSNIPNENTLIDDLKAMMSLYERLSVFNSQYLDKQSERERIKYYTHLPKSFLLLAGISGTGKSRFVREQVAEPDRKERYQLVAVRPDWHEPSDLLGYVSRLSGTAQYVMTDVLKFIVKAWQAVEKAGFIANNKVTGNRAQLPQVLPYWLCLDEMNLAPVEQYFADYLSVLETREWRWDNDDFVYHTEALLSPIVWTDITNFQQELGVSDELWAFFQQNGIGIPFNLIVAGTVNMDETTHAFSRKVLDRALSFDFSEFYPNDFSTFFKPTTKPKLLSYPIYSQLKQGDLDDKLADKSIKFLTALNQQFEHTPFKLGFRALNELLLSVHSFQPQTDEELQAVWDDFVMTKILPRIEGDETKVENVLDKIEEQLKKQLENIWEGKRPDLWREQIDEQASLLEIPCRSKVKLEQMKKLLTDRGMVSFW